MNMLQRLAIALVCVIGLTPFTAVQASWFEAQAAVDQASSQLMGILDDPAYQKIDPLMVEIESILDPVVDFPYISKRVMGKYYRKASAEQQQTFSRAFKNTLIRTYAKSLSGFGIVRYEMAPQGKPSPKPNKQIVSVYVYSANGTKYTLVYYMLKQDDSWKLVNVLVDGINLRLNFKNQFADMVSRTKGNVGQVITDWEALVSTNTKEEGA